MRLDAAWLGWMAIVCMACGATALAACHGSEARGPAEQPPLALTIAPGDSPGGLLAPRPRALGVPVTVTLSNAGKVPALVNARLLVGGPSDPHEVVLEILGPDKRARPFRSMVNASRESGSFQRLEPGASVSVVVDLAADYDLSAKGFYAVQAVYENRQDAPPGASDLEAWKGRAASPVLRIERK